MAESSLAVPARRYRELGGTLDALAFDPERPSLAEGKFAGHRLVIAHDPVRAAEQSAKRRKKIAELEAFADKLVNKLDAQDAGQTERGRKASDRGTYSPFQNAVAEAKLTRFVRADYQAERFSYDLNETAVQAAERFDGKLVLLTNVTDFSAEHIVSRYKSLADIERGFRVLKSDDAHGCASAASAGCAGAAIAPVFHRSPERIRAHALICFLALGARRRSTDFRRGCRLGERDHLVVLEKPKVRPAWMTAEQYAEVPATLTVRELRVGGKTLVTTLLSAKQVPKNELKSLYRQRWHVELDFRCLKTTMGMEMLSCKSPAMAIKEIWVYLLAYNVIRRMMLQAACMEDLLPRQLSFRHALQLCMAYRHHLAHPDPETFQAMLRLIAGRRVGQRSGRIEPRAVKRRPKAFPLLTKRRHLAREEVRIHGHPRR